jgi:propanediol dehydratase small subunit
VATNKNNSTSSTTDYSSISNNTTEDVPLADAKPEFIIKYAHERAEKDLNLYTSLAALEEDIHTKKLLLTLSKMSRDFIQDVTIGYSKFASTQLHSSFMNIPTNINSIVKRKEETPVR